MRGTLPRVRARTLAGGVVLGGALLLGLAVLGGGGQPPIPFEQRAPDRRGPISAIQPELRQALLTGGDLPRAAEPGQLPARPDGPGSASGQAGPDRPAVIAPLPPLPTGAPAGDPEAGAIGQLCRFLFEDATGLARLWPTEPHEATSRHTERHGGGALDQVLGVFDGDRSVEAYRRLRESAAGCGRFEARLTGGTPVTVLMRELAPDRREAGAADDSYTILLTLDDGSPAGWVSVDRIGPVVSVLRHLGPGVDPDEIARTRHTALHKLRGLLRTLRD